MCGTSCTINCSLVRKRNGLEAKPPGSSSGEVQRAWGCVCHLLVLPPVCKILPRAVMAGARNNIIPPFDLSRWAGKSSDLQAYFFPSLAVHTAHHGRRVGLCWHIRQTLTVLCCGHYIIKLHSGAPRR